jgi:Protein of unknown function (DUF2905)
LKGFGLAGLTKKAKSRFTPMAEFGKTLIYVGITLVVLGLIFSVVGKIPWLGNLPGDITIERERFTFYFPLTTCILISVIITLVLYFFRR